MKHLSVLATMILAVLLTVSLANTASAVLTFGQWALAEVGDPPGPVDWNCNAINQGITSLDGVNGYTNLQALDLWHNQISSLGESPFLGLTNLQALQLDSNQISLVEANSFQGLTNLLELNLALNEIGSLSSSPFQNLTNLQRLFLHDNLLSSLDASALQGLTNLQEVSFSYNQMSSISGDAFQGLSNLRILALNGNQISSLDASLFQGLANLEELYLWGNEISGLSTAQFKGLVSLQYVSLSSNLISSLGANQFEDLANLQHLYLHNNQISTIDATAFRGLANLQDLYLYGNQISSLAANQFHGLTSLQELSLWNNEITSLDLTGLDASALLGFSIYDNPIDEVVLAETVLSQTTFDTLMIGHREYSAYFGIADLAGIAEVDLSGADMSGVSQLDEMFTMADLQTLILVDVAFSNSIVGGNHAEVWSLICALETQNLDALTVDQQLYAAMKTNLDAWDAGPNNVLTVVPEPGTLAILILGGLTLMPRRRRVR